MFSPSTRQLIEIAIAEDIGKGDITSAAIIDRQSVARAVMLAQEDCVVCGHEVAQYILERIDCDARYENIVEEGGWVKKGEFIARIEGRTISLLAAERLMLNFLQRLCGIATRTAQVVERVKGKNVRILDTRKTLPGWRELEKAAVRVGGGQNHRFGLFDAVLIKNNHIDAINGDVSAAIELCRINTPLGTKIEVEVRDFSELKLALPANPDAILLDNMSPEMMREAVNIVRSAPGGERIELEASGGIDEQTIDEYAATGVDSISLGSLTHSVRAASIALRYVKELPSSE